MRSVILNTLDHHRIACDHYQHGHKKVIVLAHGFFNNKDVYLFGAIANGLAQYYDVFAFDFRGHGKSSGLFSWTSRESVDFQAVLAHVKGLGYASIGLMGFSLGAALSLIQASEDRDITTVIAVSAPTDFWKIDYRFWEPGMWEDLKLNLGYKGKGKGVWPGNPFEAKIAPIHIVDQIAPCSVLFIHGSDDWLIKPWHSQDLFNKARDPKKIEIIPHAGHAEKIFDDYPDLFMRICRDWLGENL